MVLRSASSGKLNPACPPISLLLQIEPIKKQCGHCGESKPLSEFSKDKSKALGRDHRCKTCKKRYNQGHSRPAYFTDRNPPKKSLDQLVTYQPRRIEEGDTLHPCCLPSPPLLRIEPIKKACTKCGEAKPLSAFAKGGCQLGRQPRCRVCVAEYRKEYHQRPEARELRRKRVRRHRVNNTQRVINRIKNWRQRYPEKHKAHRAVQKALKNGTLVRPDYCQECGISCFPDLHHHRGYAKEHWLDVIPLCRTCHSAAHEPVMFPDRYNEPPKSAKAVQP